MFDEMGMVRQAIQQGGGQALVAKDLHLIGDLRLAATLIATSASLACSVSSAGCVIDQDDPVTGFVLFHSLNCFVDLGHGHQLNHGGDAMLLRK
jgi:hypothetical protein